MYIKKFTLIMVMNLMLIGVLFGCTQQPKVQETTSEQTPFSREKNQQETQGSFTGTTTEQQGVVVSARQEEAPSQPADIFAKYCRACHGSQGEGTKIAPALISSSVQSKEQSELVLTVSEGRPGTAMAGWHRVLDEQTINALVEYIKHLDQTPVITATDSSTPTPIDMNNQEAVMALGAETFQTNCVSCHGENGIGGIGPSINSQQFLSRHDESFIRDSIMHGGWRSDSQMPAFGEHLTTNEITALVQYIRAWEPTAPIVDDPRGSSLAARGYGQGMMNNGQGQGHGQGQGRGQGQGQGHGQGQGQGRGQGQGQGQGMGMMRRATTISYTGQVITNTRTILTFRTNEGQTLQIVLGPPWYWSKNGIALHSGDAIRMEGLMIPNYYMMLVWLENETTHQRYEARTSSGVPLWR